MDELIDFLSFLVELVDAKELEGAVAGIASRAVDASGVERLTQQQHAALVIAVKEWLAEHFEGYSPGFIAFPEEPPAPDCPECSNPLPWCEAYIAGTMHGGICTYCVQVHHKKDD